MKRGMEKEKKGLFGRLLDFWKEKIGAGETKGIGFWNGARELENRFAEMGDAVSLKQEKKKAFWEEKVETVLGVKEETGGLLEQEKKLFFAEAEKEQKENSEVGEEGEKTEKRKVSSLFLTEVFQEERQEEAEGSKMGQAFLWEMPEMEKERRSIVPVTEKMQQEKTPVAEAERYRYAIYDWNYGIELEELYGKNVTYVIPELKKRIEDALLADDRITAVTDFSFQQEKGSVTAGFLVHTIFGEITAERTVDI